MCGADFVIDDRCRWIALPASGPCRWPLHTSLNEGMNNKIKVLKRMAYSFRDDEVLLPQDPLSLPRKSRMNQNKTVPLDVSGCIIGANEAA